MDLSHTELFVLDEADKLMDADFQKDVKFVNFSNSKNNYFTVTFFPVLLLPDKWRYFLLLTLVVWMIH